MGSNSYWSYTRLHPTPISLFNIFLNDLLFVVTQSHLSNYADDKTIYCYANSTNYVNDQWRIDLAQVMETFT